jgi:hypothetical protein
VYLCTISSNCHYEIRFQTLLPLRIVEDFRDWTNWLFYRGGIGVKGEESWEAWWEEELVIEFGLYSLQPKCHVLFVDWT